MLPKKCKFDFILKFFFSSRKVELKNDSNSKERKKDGPSFDTTIQRSLSNKVGR